MSHLWKVIGSETRDLTPELAAEFSGMPSSATEREVSPKRVSYLKQAVLGGKAIIFDWSKATLVSTGEVIRINGQHSSKVLTELNGEFPEGLKVHLSHYEVESKEAAALLFRQIDGRQSARSIADIAGVYQGLEPALAVVPKPIARAALEGVAWFNRKIVGSHVPVGDDRFDLFTHVELHPFYLMAGRICSIKTPEFTTPVMAAMFGTFEREPTWADTFWEDVAKAGGDTASNHPANCLDSWLVAAHDAKEDRPGNMEVYSACVFAWNIHRHGRTLEKITKNALKKASIDIE